MLIFGPPTKPRNGSFGKGSEARMWFAYLGWEAPPQGIRGQRILSWGADHAYLASTANPKRSVRRWCRRWAAVAFRGRASRACRQHRRQQQALVRRSVAAVLEITVRNRDALCLRFIGASDDPNYELRLAAKREKDAARSRRYRAAHSTGSKRGWPALQLSEEDRLARRRAQGAERVRRLKRAERAAECSGRPRGRPKSEGSKPWEALGISKAADFRRREKAAMSETKNASRHISNIGSGTEFSVTEFQSHASKSQPKEPGQRRAPQERARLPVVIHREVLEARSLSIAAALGLRRPLRCTTCNAPSLRLRRREGFDE